jgi:signal transduction histidine kinase
MDNMSTESTLTGLLQFQELEAVYAISKVVAESIDIDQSLDEIVKLSRPVFIFDNAALYLQAEKDGELEATFARAIGRGRSSTSNLGWGDIAAQEVIQTGQNFVHEEAFDTSADRLTQHLCLGLPMIVGGKILGALVFVRFGGPPYTEDQINLAEYIAAHVSTLLGHQQMVERIANLEAERRLAQLQEDFIATVSHELNTPLGFIKGYTTTLLREDTKWDDDTRTEFLIIIDDETDRLSELIDNLLDSSRLQAGTLPMNFELLDLNSLVKDTLHRASTRYSKREIVVNSEAMDVKIHADPRRLEQVLDNLISNAVKYAPRSKITISISATDERVCISISDNGVGIPEEHLKNLFRRFYRVPESSGGVRGSGLGLFISDRIIRSHGGEITVESEMKKGTTFHLYLPVVTDPNKEEVEDEN